MVVQSKTCRRLVEDLSKTCRRLVEFTRCACYKTDRSSNLARPSGILTWQSAPPTWQSAQSAAEERHACRKRHQRLGRHKLITQLDRRFLNPTVTGDGGSVSLETLAERFQRQANIRQKRTPLGKVINWALRDQTRCKRLIRDIKNAVEELEGVLPQTAPDSQLTHQAAVEDAQQLFVQPTEVEEPAEANATPVIEILQDATENDPVLQQVLQIVAQQAAAGDEIRNIFTSDKARVALDDFVASDYKGPAPVERQRRRVVQDVKTSGEGRLQVGKSYGGKGVFDD
jgi:hypothetical protein